MSGGFPSWNIYVMVPGMELWASRRLNTHSTMSHTPAKDPIL